MTFAQALAYFLREALTSLRRSWKVSALAVLTIAVSLFVVGLFLLVGESLERVLGRWREEAKVVVYLAGEPSPAQVEELRRVAARASWVTEVREVSATEARERFRQAFAGMAHLLDHDNPLPPSLEIAFRPEGLAEGPFQAWLTDLRSNPAADLVDDDREWLGQLAAALAVVRGLGWGLGAVLVGAATFTIASVVRLTVHLYREEIAVMRLVGATEFFIRGPFYLEGLLQGLLGGALAIAALVGARAAFGTGGGGSTLPAALLAGPFLSPVRVLTLLGVGALAGLTGAVVSLRREAIAAELSRPPDA